MKSDTLGEGLMSEREGLQYVLPRPFSQMKSSRQAVFFTRNRFIFVEYRVLRLRWKCEAKLSSWSDYSLSEVMQALQEIEKNC